MTQHDQHEHHALHNHAMHQQPPSDAVAHGSKQADHRGHTNHIRTGTTTTPCTR